MADITFAIADAIENGTLRLDDAVPLTFAQLRTANMSRCMRWHPRGINEWSLSDWMTALGGEVGEAMNIAKKLNRDRDSIVGNFVNAEELRTALADELADIAIYLDILAASENIDLAAAIVSKFNRTSAKVNFPERLPRPARAAASMAGTTQTAASTGAQQEHGAVMSAIGHPNDSGGGQEHSDIMRAIGHG
ncbi:NTP pyrophosphatase (non-canonical NTP hydrolase) [Sphingomonas zeicaulis]|uniref:hypothetical protein n=1 Tax=Sphingomonas zeicaulis TaxID=1632740 RepID=UPI003D22A09C